MEKETTQSVSFYEIGIFILSLYVLIVMIVQMIMPLSTDMNELLWMIDTGICVVFIVDFIINFVKAPNKSHYMKYGVFDLAASIPNVGFLRFGRLAKIIRVLRLIKASKSINNIANTAFKNKGEGVFKSVLLLSILIIISSSILILTFEQDNSELNNAYDSFWWTMYTVLGMDYCNPPISFIGKGIAISLGITGMTLLGTFTAYLAEIFFNDKK